MSDLEHLPPAQSLPAATRAAQRAALEDEVSSTPSTAHAPHRRGWGHRTGIALASTAALVSVTAAGAFVTHRAAQPASDTSTVRCYSVASLGDGSSYQGTEGTQADTDGASTTPADPIELCASFWHAGIVRANADNAQSMDGAEHPVPALTACLLDSGIAAVFPGHETTCQQLGLPPLAS